MYIQTSQILSCSRTKTGGPVATEGPPTCSFALSTWTLLQLLLRVLVQHLEYMDCVQPHIGQRTTLAGNRRLPRGYSHSCRVHLQTEIFPAYTGMQQMSNLIRQQTTSLITPLRQQTTSLTSLYDRQQMNQLGDLLEASHSHISGPGRHSFRSPRRKGRPDTV